MRNCATGKEVNEMKPRRTLTTTVTALREARRRRGLLQFQAAQKFGITEYTWSRYETAILPIPDDLLARIALTWNEPALLHAHPCVSAYVALSREPDDDGPDPAAPMRMTA